MAYSAEIQAEAEKMPSLGAEYFEARDVVRRFMENWTEEDAQKLADAIVKPALDAVHDKVWDSFRDHLMSDVEYNVQAEMRRMVEDSVRALIGGRKWANVKYISPEGYATEEVRETLAKLYSDEIKDGRIADLEKQVARLKDDLRFYRER